MDNSVMSQTDISAACFVSSHTIGKR